MVTATLFRVTQCKQLGSREFHEEDYGVDCDSGSFMSMAILSIVLIVIVPIGIPLGFLFLMDKARRKLPDGKVNKTLLGGAKLVPEQSDDSDDPYGFLIRDCRPEYWYVLAGISLFRVTTRN